MKRIIIFAIFIITLVTSPSMVFAQGMPAPNVVEGMGTQSAVSSDGHTAREEAEGKEIWEKLQAKQLECKNLADDNFEVLGEYFMGQMVGGSHEVMNNMMVRMLGEEGEREMHITLGKRYSGCDTAAPFQKKDWSFMPMMWMMGGGGNPMMGGWNGFGILGWLPMLLFWILLILGVVALIRYLGGSGKAAKDDKTPLEILKERYAKGEIDKKEFEEKKKDLG